MSCGILFIAQGGSGNAFHFFFHLFEAKNMEKQVENARIPPDLPPV